MPTHLENEPTLVAEARAGSAEAFTTLVKQYDRYIYRLALNITGNKEDAEDICQETLAKAIDRVDTLQTGGAFRSWLFRIAKNTPPGR